jgi:hypothetical protein
VTDRIERLRRITWWMDEGLRIPGTSIRIGLDPIIGLIPGAGDAVGAILAGTIVVEAARTGISRFTLIRMAGNIALDSAIGAVPLVGDLFDAGWKANTKNLALLQRHLDSPPTARRHDKRFVAIVGVAAVALSVAVAAGGAFLVYWLVRQFLQSGALR